MVQHAPQSFRHVPSGHRSSSLHPLVYRIIAGAGVWLVLSAWGFLGSGGYIDLTLSVVTGFVLVSIAIPMLLWRIRRQNDQHETIDEPRDTIHDWLTGEFEVWQTNIKGTDAAIGILLPLAAVALGMTIFAIEKYLAVGAI